MAKLSVRNWLNSWPRVAPTCSHRDPLFFFGSPLWPSRQQQVWQRRATQSTHEAPPPRAASRERGACPRLIKSFYSGSTVALQPWWISAYTLRDVMVNRFQYGMAWATVTPALSCHYHKPMAVRVIGSVRKASGRTTRFARVPSRRAQALRPVYCRPSRRMCPMLRYCEAVLPYLMGEKEPQTLLPTSPSAGRKSRPGAAASLVLSRNPEYRLGVNLFGLARRWSGSSARPPRSASIQRRVLTALPVQVSRQPRLRCGRP